MTQLILEIPDSCTQKLEIQARTRKKTLEEVVTDIIRTFADNYGAETEFKSCLELGEDLAGCLEYENDLSFNKKYLNGFGL